MSEDKDYSKYEFAKDETEAKQRFLEFSSKDPLPEVPPALLNSGDIYDYARITSMVFQFDKNNDNKKLKSASYEIDFLGDVYQINEKNGEVEKKTIEYDEPFTIKKNSIVFLFIKTKFFLPDYIAIRFNLKITHVHRGLLLGTGPLVDPGFYGRLLIPLHNLTSENYRIIGGDGLIWVEFTKLSPHKNWDSHARNNSASYIKFPQNKKSDLEAQKYFNKASGGQPAGSSIPGEVKSAVGIAQNASEQVHKIYEEFRKWTIIGSVVIIISISALVYSTWDLISNANQHIENSSNKIEDLNKEQFKTNQKIESLEEKIKSLTESLEKANKDLSLNAPKKNPHK